MSTVVGVLKYPDWSTHASGWQSGFGWLAGWKILMRLEKILQVVRTIFSRAPSTNSSTLPSTSQLPALGPRRWASLGLVLVALVACRVPVGFL